MITTEDLWDLTQAQLDVIYKALNKGVSEAQVSSLMCKVTDVDAELLNKIEIVKYIFNAKEEEAEARKNDAAKHAKKQRILDILAQKQEDARRTWLISMSEPAPQRYICGVYIFERRKVWTLLNPFVLK